MDRILNALFMASLKNIYMAYIVETIDKFFSMKRMTVQMQRMKMIKQGNYLASSG